MSNSKTKWKTFSELLKEIPKTKEEFEKRVGEQSENSETVEKDSMIKLEVKFLSQSKQNKTVDL